MFQVDWRVQVFLGRISLKIPYYMILFTLYNIIYGQEIDRKQDFDSLILMMTLHGFTYISSSKSSKD